MKILRAKNGPATIEEGKEIIKKLEEELNSAPREGAGLAAPQIGINKRVAIIRDPEGDNVDLINPVIIEKLYGFVNKGEGCLSLPGIEVDTTRYNEIFVKDDLHPEGFVAVGFTAVAIQHEVDHTESILIMDRGIGKYKVGRNDPCPCGAMKNGKPIKYKRCHGR